MDQPSSSFHDLFKAALLDYENQTGAKLIEHPFAKQLETCESVDSINAILQKQAQIFRKFRGDDGKIMKSLKSSVDVLYALSSTVLGAGIGLVHPKLFIRVSLSLIVILHSHSRPQMQYSLASPSFLLYVLYPIPYLRVRDIQVPQAVKDVSSSYDALVDLFASFENFLARLSIYTEVPPTPALTNVLVKIIVELLSTLALATKQVKQGRFSAFVLSN